VLESRRPFIPGDVRNAGTYGYPVLYKTIPGLTAADCAGGARQFAGAVIEAARALEAQGVKGISSDCGALAMFQDEVRESVGVPVCLSSLMQLPMIAPTLDPKRPIGIVTADATALPAALLTRPDVAVANPLIVRGMQDKSEFGSAILQAKGTLDSDLIAAEAIDVVRRLRAEHPDLGAVVLECSMLPPYARAMQRAIGLPVYDFVTMIDYLQAATHRERYVGYY
jgi:Asp/Glu/hydantoin racemase